MKRSLLAVHLSLAAAALISACGAAPASGADSPPTEPPIVSHGSEVTDYASLLDGLRQVGASVEPAGEVEQPFFSVKARIVRVDGQEAQVFEYASNVEAEAQAALVDPGGSAIGTSLVSWIGTPNFFKAGQLIVLYVGDDALTLDHLMQVLGMQFAGGPFAP